MPFDPARHRRRSIRLRGYDYSLAGAYFVTICTQRRARLFGRVINGEMMLSEAGRMVVATWNGLPEHYYNVELDAFIVMPEHVHGIVVLNAGVAVVGAAVAVVGAGFKPAPTATAAAHRHRHGLSEIIRAFKTFSARRINSFRNLPGHAVWQRNYYEHIIRNAAALNRIRRYIENNPRALHEAQRRRQLR